MEAVKRILHYLCDTPELHTTFSRNDNFELTGVCDVVYDTGNLEKARSISGTIYILSGGAMYFSARIFCNNKGAFLLARPGSYISRNKHLAIGFLGLHDWIIKENLAIDHVSTKGYLNSICFQRVISGGTGEAALPFFLYYYFFSVILNQAFRYRFLL